MIYKYIRFILDFLYPTRCPVCSEFIGYMDDFCEDCHRKINFSENPFSIPYSDFSASVCIYDENTFPAVFTLKDRGGNAPYAFALGIAELIRKYNISEKADFIVPVPMYKKDKAERGFNQCELMSKELSHILKIPYRSDIVFKIRKTRHQKELSGEERRNNLKDAFEVKNPQEVSRKNIILIDDVCTTGSTLSEVSRILKNSNAEKIFCFTYCKTDFPDISK